LNNQDHLSLRLARLKSSEELELKGDSLNFVFARSGTGKFTSAKASHRLSPKDILVFNATAGGKLGVFDGKGEFQFGTFSVCFENLLPLFASNEISLLHNLTESLKATKFYPANTPLAAECQRLLGLVPEQFNLDHRGQLIRIAASILAAEFQAAQSQRAGVSGAEDHMTQVFEKLSASDLINLSVGELAARFSCSRRHLNRLFHQHFGVSVASLRMEMRLLKAVSLLRDAHAKIINVAEECGFNHLGLFNTCFKRRFGTSPGQWRKSAIPVGSTPLRKTGKQPGCPLREVGLCPNHHEPDAPVQSAAIAVASKIADGTNILQDLKQRNLGFGTQITGNARRNLPESRVGE
jgi:AraC-like DNA-binding protein